MYYDYREPLKAVPSHRMLAMRRGEKEEVLFLSPSLAPVEEILAGLKSRLDQRGRASSGRSWKGWSRMPTSG